LIVLIPICFIYTIQFSSASPVSIVQKKREIFERKISEIAKQYIGIQYEFGGSLTKSAAVDNSNLFCLIYDEAAKLAGLRFKGYAPMEILLQNTIEVLRDKMKNGDLMVLNNGLAAMIYNFENGDKFNLIYASEKRRQVISFNCQNVVFEAFWLKNLKGYFRLSESMFVPQNNF
jgi:hypothetical protein